MCVCEHFGLLVVEHSSATCVLTAACPHAFGGVCVCEHCGLLVVELSSATCVLTVCAYVFGDCVFVNKATAATP